MSWEAPSYIEISMSAEIGGYQDEFEERAPSRDGLQTKPSTDDELER